MVETVDSTLTVSVPVHKRIAAAVRGGVTRAWQAVKLGPAAVQGAARGILIVTGLVYLAFAVVNALGPFVPGVAAFLALAALGALLLFLGQGIAWGIGLLAKIPWTYRWGLPAGVGLLYFALMRAPENSASIILAALVLGGSLVGAGAAALPRASWAGLTRVQRIVSMGGLALGAVILLGVVVWYAWRGPAPAAVTNAALLSGAPLERVTLPDPSQPGPYSVKTLTYGAGTDRYRPEYGQAADLLTRTVDGSPYLFGSWTGFPGQLRELWWGFNQKALPLNGRVWYPALDGASDTGGPFPLVLVVHGNHSMADFSDPGYDYLGELLASRGFIVVSVDQNFINGGIVDFMDGFSGENDARGWLLLEHLNLWRTWSRDTDNPFYGLADLDNIAVMGHSRGGEAAALAAAFNRLPHYPDAGEQVFNYNFNIRAVVAIAPIDGQYVPSWKPVQLENINYLVLHGSHDSDVSSFDGINVYERLKFTDGKDWFKSAVYIHRANHGQFNTTWGDSDKGELPGGFLNRGELLAKAEQEQAAKVYISAFLEAALKGQTGYLPLLADSRAAGSGWLPDVVYINRFEQAGDRMAVTFEEDANLRTGTLPGVKTEGKHFNHWREQKIHSKWAGLDTTGVYLKWNESGLVSVYEITLPESGFAASADGSLIFALADANQDPPAGSAARDANGDKQDAAAPQSRQPIDLSVEVEDADGTAARLPLSQYALVQPQIRVKLFKDALAQAPETGEPVLRSYELPLADFAAANPDFDPSQVRVVRFVFDRTPRGSLILDGVGFRD